MRKGIEVLEDVGSVKTSLLHQGQVKTFVKNHVHREREEVRQELLLVVIVVNVENLSQIRETQNTILNYVQGLED